MQALEPATDVDVSQGTGHVGRYVVEQSGVPLIVAHPNLTRNPATYQ